jgi:hypothetical protein
MAEFVQAWVPLAWEAFTDYRREAVPLSRLEARAIGLMLAGADAPPPPTRAASRAASCRSSPPSSRACAPSPVDRHARPRTPSGPTTTGPSTAPAATPPRSATSTGTASRTRSASTTARPCSPSPATHLNGPSWSPSTPRTPADLPSRNLARRPPPAQPRPVRVEAAGPQPLVAARQPLERQPPPDRGVPARPADPRPVRRASPPPLQPAAPRPRAPHHPPAEHLVRPHRRPPPLLVPARPHLDPLARGLEVRRALVPLLPARPRPRRRRHHLRRRPARLARPGAPGPRRRRPRYPPRPPRAHRPRARAPRDPARRSPLPTCPRGQPGPRLRTSSRGSPPRLRPAPRTGSATPTTPGRSSPTIAEATRRPPNLVEPITPPPTAAAHDFTRRRARRRRRHPSAPQRRRHGRPHRPDPRRFLRAAAKDPPPRRPARSPSLAGPASVDLAIFVHRVEDLDPGLYFLLRDPAALARWRRDTSSHLRLDPGPRLPRRPRPLPPANRRRPPDRRRDLVRPGHRRRRLLRPRHARRLHDPRRAARGIIAACSGRQE